MKRIKKIIKCSSLGFLLLITLVFILTILIYFDVLESNITDIIKYIIPILFFAFSGFLIGKTVSKNGWLEGIYISIFLSIIMLIITIVLNKFKIDYFLYILILIISGTFGSMIGINKKS